MDEKEKKKQSERRDEMIQSYLEETVGIVKRLK